jgi:dihydroorotate dehydrogenase (NAD+) catalytic subunit
VDPGVAVGSLRLVSAVMTASGTSGHGAELSAYMDLARLGAVVVKSLSADPWPGNPAPRLHPTPAGMLNSVGLEGPGVAVWMQEELPPLAATGAAVVVSIWGRHAEDFARAAQMVGDCGAEVVAVELNLSCPNLDGGAHLFAHDPVAAAEAVAAAAPCGRPRWAKLSANTDRLVEVAAAVSEAGAEAVTLVNTLLGMVIDVEARRPVLGGGGGGLSGPAVHPVAVRSVFDVHRALPEVPIVGVGGIATAEDAVEMLMAGASAVQVGTASFADPAVAEKVRVGLEHWCLHHGVAAVADLKGSAHG